MTILSSIITLLTALMVIAVLAMPVVLLAYVLRALLSNIYNSTMVYQAKTEAQQGTA
ncbi:hypothetical protein JCM17960_25320 [Magnetospira thiophila]